MYSDYLDAATASCESVNDFFLERTPDTTCSMAETYAFISRGWEGVNIIFEGSIGQCKPRKWCEGELSQNLGTSAFLTLTGILDRMIRKKRSKLQAHFHS